MQFKTKIFLLMLLCEAVALENKPLHLRFLNKLIKTMEKEREITTIFMLQHQHSNNCQIQDWYPRGIPILRSNGLSNMEVKAKFNYYHTIALVCITNNAEINLLDNLAINFDHMRQEGIILWMQIKATEEIQQKISQLSELYQFTRILIMEIVNTENGTINIHRMNPYPSPKFEKIQNIFKEKKILIRPLVNFRGRIANVLTKKDAIFRFNVSIGPTEKFPISSDEDLVVVEFARRYNFRLRQSKDPNNFDMQLSPRLVSSWDLKESANPFSMVSLMVVVPCGKEKSIQDVFKQLDFGIWLLYILPVYVIFVVVETLMMLVINRISNQTHNISFLSPLVNLRAFGAILGMSFPISRRWNFSLRQLLLILSIFGFVFSNFFACKLSALLTKQSRYAQIKNLEELQASGLPVIIERYIFDYLTREVDHWFIRKTLPNALVVDQRERARLILSLNTSFAYVTIKENWLALDRYQFSMGRSVFCQSNNLTLLSNLPNMYFISKNSIFKWSLRDFIQNIYAAGLTIHWKRIPSLEIREILNVTIVPFADQKANSLHFEHFNWLWTLLLLGYGIAILVFFIEMVFGNRKRCTK
ncbi:hypothetical protein KR009_011086 [Drosophila setifemur]|nr:hypothetical protein KR009_011086 [Drosophila setifemur]